MSTRQIEVVDYYAELGVEPDASPAQIGSAYRALAKALHPDARPTDPAAADRFKRVTMAYRVLADVERRRDYDERRAHGLAPVAAAERPVATTPPASPPSRRNGRWAVVGGIVCMVFGIAAAVLIITLQRHDADLRDRGTATTATVVLDGTERRLEFTTATGQTIHAPEPLRTGTGQKPVGSHVQIRYDPNHPTQVITNDDKLARDITLWIVAAKLVLVGAFFVWWGARRLRRTR
ncbi:MAG TPA: DnaJ domain-containing protein [Acidimicrobiia bacterium]